jgi:hypothetical protein
MTENNMTENNNNCTENIDELTDTIDISINSINSSKSSKSIRTKFAKACSHCNKVLKSEKTYNKHTNNQLCYSKNEITFCKICNITMSTHENYIKHILSMEHLNSIGCNKLEILHNNQPSTILQADPYLSNNEAQAIGTNNLGNKFTFVFQNNQTQTVDLIAPKTNLLSTCISADISSVSIDNTTANTLYNHSNHSNHSSENISEKKILEPTDKQKKIILILERVGNDQEGRTLLLKMLDKLHIEDYYGLQSFIKCNNNISKQLQTIYLDIIDKFINMLVKLRNNGETIYKDKNISKLVISLTS